MNLKHVMVHLINDKKKLRVNNVHNMIAYQDIWPILHFLNIQNKKLNHISCKTLWLSLSLSLSHCCASRSKIFYA